MGIESALIGAGWSASAAATASAVVGAVGTAALGAVVSSAMTPKQKEQPQSVAPVTAADKPQAAKQVEADPVKQKNAMLAAATGALAGNNSTLLTGSSGVDPSGLNLGKNTLLGA